ncbi:hypothetical protein [Hymenobacter guriensis]|uniref:Uncharacterized protein n=1 Tax=Hymenobacter guriensis TaxID=2793065 RepID=A0ABS0L4Q1_9BACT|nr:hypothetical protein [Hymenobacter guriensis]MBG8555097.1 hypothetical protein [Hymenobacter guriensis]
MSDRLRMEHYPTYLQRFRERGIAAFFMEGRDGRVIPAMWPPRGKKVEVALWPKCTAALQRDPVLMEALLMQMLWCMDHPLKTAAMFWAVTQGAVPFGDWPHLLKPKELDQVGSLWLTIYRGARKSAMPDDVTMAGYVQALTLQFATQEEYAAALLIQVGHFDQLLAPGIRTLLDGTGVVDAG